MAGGDQLQPAHHGFAVALLPRGTAQDPRPQGLRAGFVSGGEGLELAGLLPELLRHRPGGHRAAEAALQPQPAVAALAAQLPAGQHGLHPGGGAAVLEGAVEEGEGQQHPRPGQRGAALGGHRQAAEAHGAEPLRQLEAARAAQLEAVGPAAGGQAEAGGAIPEEAESLPLRQLRQQRQGIPQGQRHRQAEHALLLQLPRPLGRGGEELGEAGGGGRGTGGGSLHRGAPKRLLKCMDLLASAAAGTYVRAPGRRKPSRAGGERRRIGGGSGRRRSSGRCMRWR